MINEAHVEAALKELFDNIEFTDEPARLYDPLRFMISIGGKRLRPRLCLTTYALYKDSFDESVLQPAAGLEVFHSFTLIHDDIMDKSPVRRGMPTVWTKWGEDGAILSGDVMCIDSYKRVAKAPAKVLGKVLELFSTTASQVCDGQQLDMDFEKRSHVEMSEYMQMIGLKTGVLIACAAQMGALIGGAPLNAQKSIYNYGYLLGLAFQVADDYLDAYGDEKVFGKPIGGDILNGKKSWLTVRAQELGAKGLEEALADNTASPAEKIARVKAIYDSVSVADEARRTIAELSAKAIDKAREANLPEGGVEALERFAHALVGRVK